MSLLTIKLSHDTPVHATNLLGGNYGFLNINFVNVPDPQSANTHYANFGCKVTVEGSHNNSAFFRILDVYTANAKTNDQLNKSFYTTYSNDDIEFYGTTALVGRNYLDRLSPVPGNTDKLFVPFTATGNSRYHFLTCQHGRSDGTNFFIPFDKTLITPGTTKITVECTIMSFTEASAHDGTPGTTAVLAGTPPVTEVKAGAANTITVNALPIGSTDIKTYHLQSVMTF